MSSEKGKIVLMGSGELTGTMVEVHKSLLSQLTGSRQAAFLDTPAGFQLNVDQISQKATDYFRAHVRHPLSVASFKHRERITELEAEQAFHTLRKSAYILVGPGSPTYAVGQWRESPVPDILTQCVIEGGCLAGASAAALTLGRFTLPVYEIYKVGQQLHWIEGLDILGRFDIRLVVIPHWNNAEGGTHDTSCCFMGRDRFRKLEKLLPENVPVFGIDEHTACILDFETDMAQVKGIGTVTLRGGGSELVLAAGASFPLDVLRGEGAFDSRWKSPAKEISPQLEPAEGVDAYWDRVHDVEARFHSALDKRDANGAANALLELDRIIWEAQTEAEDVDVVVQSRDTFRECVVLLGTALAACPRSEIECLTPLVNELLELREGFRSERQWAVADAIRDILRKFYITVEDTENGVRWLSQPEPASHGDRGDAEARTRSDVEGGRNNTQKGMANGE